MKLGFIGRSDLEGVREDAKFAVEHGFEGLEYNYWANFAELTNETVSQMRESLDEHGAKAAALGLWGWNHLAADRAEQDEARQHLGRAIEFAETLGADVLITGAGEIPDAPLAENVAAFVEFFPPYLDRARQAGLTVALYPLHGNSFLDSPEAYERVWEHIPEVGIKLDPANIRHHGDDYLALLRDYGDRVAHMHIKEHLYIDGELASQPPAGMGDVEWGKVMTFLYEREYDGYLIIEPHGPVWSRDPLRHKMILLSKRHIEQFLL